jgi:hypothetical protein
MLNPAGFLRTAFRAFVLIVFLVVLAISLVPGSDVLPGRADTNMGATEALIQRHSKAFGASAILVAAAYLFITVFGHRFPGAALKVKVALKSLAICCCLAMIVAEVHGLVGALTHCERQMSAPVNGYPWAPHLFAIVVASIGIVFLVRSFARTFSNPGLRAENRGQERNNGA